MVHSKLVELVGRDPFLTDLVINSDFLHLHLAYYPATQVFIDGFEKAKTLAVNLRLWENGMSNQRRLHMHVFGQTLPIL